MKELENNLVDKVEVIAEQKKQLQLLGSTHKHPGHNVFEMVVKTGEINVAKIEDQPNAFNPLDKTAPRRKKVVINEGCLYVTALNIASAKKKFVKHFNKQINEYLKDNQS